MQTIWLFLVNHPKSYNIILPYYILIVAIGVQRLRQTKQLEMCQYDTDSPAQGWGGGGGGHPYPHAGILQEMKLKKGPLIIIGRFYAKLNLTCIL